VFETADFATILGRDTGRSTLRNQQARVKREDT
jgi:hypothetical protein